MSRDHCPVVGAPSEKETQSHPGPGTYDCP